MEAHQQPASLCIIDESAPTCRCPDTSSAGVLTLIDPPISLITGPRSRGQLAPAPQSAGDTAAEAAAAGGGSAAAAAAAQSALRSHGNRCRGTKDRLAPSQSSTCRRHFFVFGRCRVLLFYCNIQRKVGRRKYEFYQRNMERSKQLFCLKSDQQVGFVGLLGLHEADARRGRPARPLQAVQHVRRPASRRQD